MKDVIVVGGGPAGSYVSYRLSKQGFSVLQLEEHREIGKPVECTGLVSKRVLDFVPTKSIANVVHGANVFFPDGKSIHLRKDEETIVLYRDSFDKDAAAQSISAGTDLRINAKATGVSVKNDGCDVTFRENGNIRQERSRIVIGADGINSVVRRDVFNIRPTKIVSTLQYDVAGKTDDQDSVNVYLGSSLTHGFFGWAVPGGDITRIGTGSYRTSPKPYMERLISKFGENKILSITGAGIPISVMRKLEGYRTILVGDAAGVAKPLSGGGIYTGLLSSYMASIAVSDALEKEEYTDSLKSYRKMLFKKIGRELKIDGFVQNIFSRINDRSFDRIYNFISNKKIIDVINRSGDIDYPSKVLIGVIIRDPAVLYSMLK
ncbi:MAG: geranylgeranyl reductase family protein [Thermoplasmata archaeon]